MKMKVTFIIAGRDDAEVAAGQCAALADAFRLIEDPECFTKKVEVPTAAVAETAVVPETAAAEVETAPVVMDPVPAKRKPGRPKKNGTATLAEPATVIDPEKLGTLAKERGIEWLRPILVKCGAARFGDLSDVQVSELLHHAT